MLKNGGVRFYLHMSEPCNEKEKSIKKEDWTKLKHKSLGWDGLDKYREVFHSVDWGWEGKGLLWHKMWECEMWCEASRPSIISKKKREETIQKDKEQQKKMKISHHHQPESQLLKLLVFWTGRIFAHGVWKLMICGILTETNFTRYMKTSFG